MIFASLFLAFAAWGSPTQFYPVRDYRHLRLEATNREPEDLPPMYRNARAHFLALDVYVGVADRVSSAFLRAKYRVQRDDGESVDVDTGLRNLVFTDAAVANLAVRMRSHFDAKKAVFANSPLRDFREPMFTEPAVVVVTGDSVLDFYHEVSIAIAEDEFNRLDRDFEVEVRLKHQQDLHRKTGGINANRFLHARARVSHLDEDEARMINRLTYLARCEAGLVAN